MDIIVKSDDTLLNYLYTNSGLPKKKVKQLLVHGAISVNKTVTTKYDFKVGVNDKISINSKNSLGLNIIYEDSNIIAVDKPSGLLTISTEKEKNNTLYHLVSDYVKSRGKNNKIFIVHRLDKDTSGIIVFAKNEKIKNELQDNWNKYVSLREYIAVVEGRLEKKKDTIKQYLFEDKSHMVHVSKFKDGEEAITKYEVIKENNNYSLVKINILTGKKNQIRVAFSSINHPIVGDSKYGSNEKRLYLHASKLKMYYPILKKEKEFVSEIPKDFLRMVGRV